MGSSVATARADRHRELPETADRMVRGSLRKPEMCEFREEIGRVVTRARALVGWSLKEFAGKVGRDERQVARWENGQERAQFDVLFAVAEFRGPLVQALAEATGAAEVRTEITIRRTA